MLIFDHWHFHGPHGGPWWLHRLLGDPAICTPERTGNSNTKPLRKVLPLQELGHIWDKNGLQANSQVVREPKMQRFTSENRSNLENCHVGHVIKACGNSSLMLSRSLEGDILWEFIILKELSRHCGFVIRLFFKILFLIPSAHVK